MLVCRVRKKNSKSESLQVEKDSACDALSFSASGKHNRSNSDTQNEESGGAAMSRRLSLSSEDEESARAWEDSRLLDPRLNAFYDEVVEAYGDLLYGWGLLQQRTEVVKEVSEVRRLDRYTTNISLFCPTCGKVLRGPWCMHCHVLALTCSVCRAPCRGLVALCQQCGHGGHTAHLHAWFKDNIACPAGCGCKCPKKKSPLLNP